MKTLLKGALVYRAGVFRPLDVALADGVIADISPDISPSGFDSVFQLNNRYILPGFVDVHVHLREPGFLYKETMASGTAAAAKGGFCAVCAMPNLAPPPDCAENLRAELRAIERGAAVRVYPYGAITKGRRGAGELVDFASIAGDVIGFSDDGNGVQDEALMLRAMEKIAQTGKILAAHCEDEALLGGGGIHAGEYARRRGVKGISSQSEWAQVERDLRLAKLTGCKYHVCHVSTRESLDLIRRAKDAGVDATCETAPHYVALCDMDMRDEGRFKMNPPLRSADDRRAIIEAIKDGTVDMLATDHAPHSAAEKSGGLSGSLMGVVGLETAFPALYTALVGAGAISLGRLAELMSAAPAKRFGIALGLETGQKADLTAVDIEREYEIDSAGFVSMGRSTPFEGMSVRGEAVMTISGGEIVWKKL